MSGLYKVSGNVKIISKKSGLTFPFVNFYETLQKFENLSEGLKRNRRTFSDCLPAHFYGVSDSLRPF